VNNRAAVKLFEGDSLVKNMFLFGFFLSVILAMHLPYLRLPYFWDEMGQFVPAALDIARDGAWIPHSATPNVHPPGVMAYLALVWRVTGYSVVATRVAMLLIAALGLLLAYLLAIELCPTLRGPPTFIVSALLLISPLFYIQAMLAQLDMPAMVVTTLSLLLFLKQRYGAAACACTVLVLVKETGVVAPGLFLLWLVFRERRISEACYFLAPLAALGVWLVVLRRATGNWLGNPEFANFNVTYALHPVRVASAFLCRLYYLFVAEFRWAGTLAIVLALWKTRIFATPKWALVGLFAALHVLLVSLFGGAELERYILPVLPVLYISFAAAWALYSPMWRRASVLIMVVGLIVGLFWDSPFPGHLENNLSLVNFVRLHEAAAVFLEEHPPRGPVASAFPFTHALTDPLFGYIHRPLPIVETDDFQAQHVTAAIDPAKVGALVVYSRTWEPQWKILQWPPYIAFLRRYYGYEPQISDEEIRARFGFIRVARWDLHGQWIEVFSNPGL
jgi:small basic protein